MSDFIEAIGGGQSRRGQMAQGQIRPETKEKLEALGIDSSQIKTEKEAQEKIQEAQSAQANSQVKEFQFSHPMGEVMEDAKNLAEKIGIRVGNCEDIEKLLDMIDKQIRAFEEEVKDDKDDERRKMVAGVKSVYDEIHAQYEQSLAEQRKITGNLDMIASYNMIRS